MAVNYKELVKSGLFVVLLVLMALLSNMTCQRELVSAEARFLSKGCVLHSSDCHVEAFEAERPSDAKGDADPGSDGGDDRESDPAGDDYDFYRQYGDVPSPGIGH